MCQSLYLTLRSLIVSTATRRPIWLQQRDSLLHLAVHLQGPQLTASEAMWEPGDSTVGSPPLSNVAVAGDVLAIGPRFVLLMRRLPARTEGEHAAQAPATAKSATQPTDIMDA